MRDAGGTHPIGMHSCFASAKIFDDNTGNFV